LFGSITYYRKTLILSFSLGVLKRNDGYGKIMEWRRVIV
jgi:hypothetical protein